MLGFKISILDRNSRSGLRAMILGPTSEERAEAEALRRLQPMPEWFEELDEHDDSEVVRLAFSDEVGEVVATRTGAQRRPAHGSGCDGSRNQKLANRKDGRGRCPRTR